MASLDDLDNALFGRIVSDPKSSAAEAKKKVMFKDFHVNDQDFGRDIDAADSNDNNNDLFDSDQEDNNGLQGSFRYKSQNVAKDNKLSNLFGIKSEAPVEVEVKRKQLSTENLNVVKPLPNPVSILQSDKLIKKSDQKMKSLFDDSDDITSNLVDGSKTASSNQSKKSMLMQDLFGSKSQVTSKTDTTTTTTKKSSLNYDSFLNYSNTGESATDPKNEGPNQTPGIYSMSAPKDTRRGRRASAVPADPLGLLSSSNLQIDSKENETKQMAVNVPDKSENVENLPEWLGGPKFDKVRSEGSASGKSNESIKKSSTDLASTIPVESTEQSALASKLLSIEFDQQASIMSLQQQEHELRTAGALAQQSERLNYLLETQRMKLGDQERQFNMLISRQLERQALLETQMKAQQERIDNYIKTLAAQPTTVLSASLQGNVGTESKEMVDEKVESESLVQKLQLEKLYLENTLDSLKEKHEKEISILEDSYKRQIAFLEEAMIQMEKRLQDDAESLEADYKSKIQKLKEEILDNYKTHMAEKDMLKEEYTRLIQEIRDHHSRSFTTLEKEHTETIERITKSKESERQALEVMRVESTNVQNVLNKSQFLIDNLEDLSKKLASRDAEFAETKSAHLTSQEKNIEFLKEMMEKQKNDFMEEKQKLMETVRSLESNIVELTREFRTQSANFKEGEQILKSREQALLRDREIFVEQTTWERERLQAMRDTWTKEQDLQLEWLAQERQAVAAEKGKLEIFNRLKSGVDQASKAELEASLRAAEEAAANAAQETIRWKEKRHELEAQESSLRDKEARLVQKAKELQEFTQAAIAKRDEGMRALKEARFIEERYKQKLNQLQLQQELLAQREAKLAAEKLDLARERLALREKVDKPEKDLPDSNSKPETHHLSLDKRGIRADNFDAPMSSQHLQDIMDPHLILLNLDLNNLTEMSRNFPLASSH